MYGFLRSPKWIAGHVLLVVTVVAFTNLGLWQLRRLDQARASNAVVAERMAQGQQPLGDLLADVDPSQHAYRRVSVRGSYMTDAQRLTTPRARSGGPGHQVLTPLRSDAGPVVLVDRGWIPFDRAGPPVDQATPPSGLVTVHGMLMPPEPGAGPDDRELIQHIDASMLSGRVGEDLLATHLRLVRQQPPQPGALPLPTPDPVLDEGSHQSYAVQWFLFAATALVGYPLLLRRTARDRAAERRTSGPRVTQPVS